MFLDMFGVFLKKKSQKEKKNCKIKKIFLVGGIGEFLEIGVSCGLQGHNWMHYDNGYPQGLGKPGVRYVS